MKLLWLAFGVFGFLSVAGGAFGAHGLKEVLSEKYMEIFHTGIRYQFYHTLALGIVLILSHFKQSKLLNAAGLFFVLGIFIFSGSLYILALTQVGMWGAVTPIGGVCFLIGWALLIVYGGTIKVKKT